MAIKKQVASKVGLEAEFLLINAKDEIIIPPKSWDRDGFPLLAEIRGKEGETVAETVTNFKAREMGILDDMRKGHTMRMSDLETINLALYKKANREADWEDKNEQLNAIKNIHGINIEDFSDQIVKSNKIQGIRVSCGLHIHFSSGEFIEFEHEEEQYEQVILPVGLSMNGELQEPDERGNFTEEPLKLARELVKPTIYLFRHKGYKKDKKVKLYASRLNKPAIHYIVKALDEAFFDRFAPEKADRTKYRQPGFYELKDYGFEYRSLPANARTMAALPEIAAKAFELLKEINEF